MQKFVDDMATAGLNFIRDTTAYEEELSSSNGVVFAASVAHSKLDCRAHQGGIRA